MGCFYQHDETWWLSVPLERLIRIATEIELQLTQWYIFFLVWLKWSFRTNHSSGSTTCHKLGTRLAILRSCPLRRADFLPPWPLARLYRESIPPIPIPCTISPHGQPNPRESETICSKTYRNVSQARPPGIRRHRHHGTWYQIRECVSMCFLLLVQLKVAKFAFLTHGGRRLRRLLQDACSGRWKLRTCGHFDAS